MTRLVPPVAALKAAVVIAAPVVAGAALAWWVGGQVAALGVMLGVAGGLQAAVTDLSWSLRLPVASAVPLVAGLGVAADGHPWWAGLLVGAGCLAQWPVGPRAGAVAGFLPVVAALTSSVGLADPWRVAAWTAAGVALIVAVAAVLPLRAAPQPVSVTLARRHALVAAVATGLAMVVCGRAGVSHGYWLVITLALVLRPVPGETSASARDRTIGTVAGTALGIAAAVLLPLGWVLGFLVVCLALTLAWAFAQDLLRQTLFNTPIVVLVGSSGVGASPVGIGAERVALKLLAAVAAVLLAALLHRWDAPTDPAAVQPV